MADLTGNLIKERIVSDFCTVLFFFKDPQFGLDSDKAEERRSEEEATNNYAKRLIAVWDTTL